MAMVGTLILCNAYKKNRHFAQTSNDFLRLTVRSERIEKRLILSFRI